MSWEKDVLMNLAGQIGKIRDDLKPVWNSKNLSMSAGHEAGIILSHLQIVESKLIKLSGVIE